VKNLRIVAKGKEADVYLFDEIGDGWVGGVSAKKFADDLKALGRLERINLHINSPGGSVFEAVAIFNTLRKNGARVVVSIDGIAASSASVVAMSGDEIKMAANAMMMIHSPWVQTAGDAAELRQTAALLDKVAGTLVGTYARRTGKPEEEIAALMAAETWMNAEEAVALGFADSIGQEMKIAASVRGDVLSRFRNVPESLKARLTQQQPPADRPRLAATRERRQDMRKFLKERNW
jgi:ATP-dependent Clp endopeptidase proteolytic subunit ClpP